MANDIGIDPSSVQNEILLNPRWPQRTFDILFATAMRAQEKAELKAHVWIATSGSTSADVTQTKLVALSKTALLASAQAVNRHLNVAASDVWCQVLPRFHVGGLGVNLRAFLSGAKVVPGLQRAQWDPLFFYQTLKNENATFTSLVPTQIFDLVVTHQLRAPESLKAVVIGGGAFSETLYLKSRELGWPVLPSYGMTETASQIATASLASLKDNQFPAIDLLSHAKARQTEDGYLEVYADSLFSCYARNQEEEIEIWDPKVDGWFKTEDRGFVLGKSLSIEGRSQDYIKIGGEATNIALLRTLLDNLLVEQNPQWVAKVALLAMPSERLGWEIHLATTLDEVCAQTIQDRFVKVVRPFEKIRQVHCLKEIPRSDLGKVKWGELRRLCEARRESLV